MTHYPFCNQQWVTICAKTWKNCSTLSVIVFFKQPGWFFSFLSRSLPRLDNRLHCHRWRSSLVWFGLNLDLDKLPLTRWELTVSDCWRRIEGALCSVYREGSWSCAKQLNRKKFLEIGIIGLKLNRGFSQLPFLRSIIAVKTTWPFHGGINLFNLQHFVEKCIY